MKKQTGVKHEFVEFIPEVLREGIIYISMRFGTASHLCCCGCGNKVVTPIRPTDWQLIFDGKTVSLYPSIGNWGFKCRSHYWIKNNRVVWAAPWSKEKIADGRAHDQQAKERYFSGMYAGNGSGFQPVGPAATETGAAAPGIWEKVKRWWQGFE
ncbi:MAG: hypothetical protein A4E63_01550 [Syntrophorhabdus sp. PtaU1.Bin050]|nr:MAG: hypothetical protein A4E63_01550 [Syntrophorhabdus sp. PtaU1.Bin050]